jgi:hypothetical protein
MKFGLKQSFASAAIFVIVLLLLVSVDSRVRERFVGLAAGDGVSTLSARAGDLGTTLVTAAKYQSIENAPMVIFATIGAILVVFMLKV